jgi:hypothetical protein
LKNVTFFEGTLEIETGAAGEQIIWIGNNYARPTITSKEKISVEIMQDREHWVISLKEDSEATIMVELKE